MLRLWSNPDVPANVATDLAIPEAGQEALLVGLIISHAGTMDAADVRVTIAGFDNAYKGTLFMGLLGPGDSVHIDTKVALAASSTPDKVCVRASVAGVSILLTGDVLASAGSGTPSGGAAAAWLVGAGAPEAGFGKDGDMYLNKSTGDVYGPKTAGAWGEIVVSLGRGDDEFELSGSGDIQPV